MLWIQRHWSNEVTVQLICTSVFRMCKMQVFSWCSSYVIFVLLCPAIRRMRKGIKRCPCPSVRASFCASVLPSFKWALCERNSSYNFIPILLKLYRCFCQGLKMCMTFGYNPQINFCHFFHSLNLVLLGLNYYWSLWTLGTLWAQLLLQFYPNPFETLQVFLSRTEDVDINLILILSLFITVWT